MALNISVFADKYGLKNRSKLFWGISDLGNTIHGAGNE